MANFLKLFKKKDGTPPARQTPSASGSGTGVPPSGSRRSSNASKGSSAVASGTGSKAGSKAGTPAGTPAPELPQSEFARSAHEAARRGLREPPREIDENTALSSLTDAEIMRLMEGMEDNVLSQVSTGL
jgi:hypothetical protein